MSREIGARFTLIYRDEHLVEVRVAAWNGRFGGVADVYLGLGDLEQTADLLQGFPKNLSDVREVVLGAFGPESAGGAVRLRFYCTDRSGHTRVDVEMESDFEPGMPAQKVSLSFAIEPAAVDNFTVELLSVKAVESTAFLKGQSVN